jgi:hypothetical protein
MEQMLHTNIRSKSIKNYGSQLTSAKKMEDNLLEGRNSKIRGDNTICTGEWRDDQGDCAWNASIGHRSNAWL